MIFKKLWDVIKMKNLKTRRELENEIKQEQDEENRDLSKQYVTRDDF